MEITLGNTAPPDGGDSLVFGGDVRLSQKHWPDDPITADLRSFIRSSRISVANLEAPVEGTSGIPKDGPVLSTSHQTPRTLKEEGFDVVSLANNHIMDFGEDGLRKTLSACHSAGLTTCGAGLSESDAIEATTKDVEGFSVGLVALAEPEEGLVATDEPMVGWIRKPGITRHVESVVAGNDVTVLIAHGGIEYVPIPPSAWRRLLRRFADLGVDAVVAHHPHNPQGWEIHHGVPIFYSLGNLLMYGDRPGTKWNYLVGFEITDDGLAEPTVYINEIRDSRVGLMDHETVAPYWEYLQSTSHVIGGAQFEAHWQEIAMDLYKSRYYSGRLRSYGIGTTMSLLVDPVRELERLTRGVYGNEAHLEKEGLLLNRFQKESHRDVFLTALETKLGYTPDYRTASVHTHIRDWYPYYDGKPEQPPTRIWLHRLETLARRIAWSITPGS